MKILLAYPEFPDTFWSFRHALPFIRKRAAFPPLGLITVAAMLPKEWEVRLVDLNVGRLSDADLRWADYVFISAMAAQRESVNRLIVRCRIFGKKIVAGGPLFTSEPEAFPAVDYFVLNEAELTLRPFLADLERHRPKRVYSSDEFSDMAETPIPRWELLDMDAYVSMSLQWSRGCPFSCDFCDITRLFGHQPRLKTAARMIAELDSLCAAGWRKGGVFFVDDNFIGNKARLKTELLPALIAWQAKTGHRLTFLTEASINLADDQELMRLMVEAGFTRVFIGIETPEESSLQECGKRQNQGRDLVADVRRIQRSGLAVDGGFIVGFDSDQPSTFQRQIDFIMQSGIVTAMVGILSAPYGTKLWKRLKEAGRIRGDFTGDNADGTTNIVPLMDPEMLRQGYRSVMQSLYSPVNYYRRVRIFLREYRAPKVGRVWARLNWQRLLAFFRACWRLGLIKRGGRYRFWELIIWTFFHKPRLFPLVIELAINGYHFRLVAQRV